MRIVSLLPSATDLVCALGLRDQLVGRTHECDWPEGIQEVPAMTSDVLDTASMGSREIHDAVGGALHSGSSIYGLNVEALREAKPDLILTQELCEVCAVSYREVSSAVRMIEGEVKVISLEPRSLDDVLEQLLVVGRLTGTQRRAEEIVTDAGKRLALVERYLKSRSRPRTFCVEWLDPVFAAGHWVPEQVALAGGVEVLGRMGEPSHQVQWEEVRAQDPEVLVLMPCGLSIPRASRELEALSSRPGWGELRAVSDSQVWAVNGPAYFNRPGPRTIRGVEVLASVLHPEVFEPEEAVRIPV